MNDPELRIAELEGQVAALQAALLRRSDEMRLLQRFLCPYDLAQLARLAAGLPLLPRIATEPAYWQETPDLTVAEVPETLVDLWASLYPPVLSPSAPPAVPALRRREPAAAPSAATAPAAPHLSR